MTWDDVVWCFWFCSSLANLIVFHLAPSKLPRKEDISIGDFFQVDIRVGTIVAVLDFPEMRKPSYKIEVDFGPVVGKLWSSAQVGTEVKWQYLLLFMMELSF